MRRGSDRWRALMNAVCESGVQALSKSQLGSMIGAADPNNPIMVGIAAYVAKNVVDGNRAAQEWLLDWEEVELVERSDKVVGMQTHIGLTKKDRKQKGAVKNTPCPSDCTGEIVYDKDGCFDAAAMCPVHLLQYLRVLWADQLQVEPKDVKGPLWSDFARFEDTPKGMTLVTIDDNSPAYAYKDMPKIQFKVMTREEERVSGLTSGLYFEVEGQPYACHAWGDANHVTARLRALAVAVRSIYSLLILITADCF